MFKYLPEGYCASLLTMGVIQIGTLHDFRRSEHKRGIADPGEGKKVVFHHIDNLPIEDSNEPAIASKKDVRALGAFNAIRMQNCKNVRISNVTVAQPFDEPDIFILCLSSMLSAGTMEQFEGVDSCYEVVDRHRFFGYLTETLNDFVRVVFHGVFPVTYQDRTAAWNGADWGRSSAVVKPREFASQFELRAIWKPRFVQSITPLRFMDRRLPGLCRAVQVPHRAARVAA